MTATRYLPISTSGSAAYVHAVTSDSRRSVALFTGLNAFQAASDHARTLTKLADARARLSASLVEMDATMSARDFEGHRRAMKTGIRLVKEVRELEAKVEAAMAVTV